MRFPPPSPPDGPLHALRVGTFPAPLKAPVLREGARAFAKYVEGGGRLSDIQESASRFQAGHLSLMPLPKRSGTLPRRSDLEQDLLHLRSSWAFLIADPKDASRFWVRFFRELGKRNRVFRSYARLRLEEMARHTREENAAEYESFLQEARKPADLQNGVLGLWKGPQPLTSEQLHALVLRQIESHPESLNQAPRASVHEATVSGLPIIIKRFAPNPRPWRKKLGPSRARRAWAGSMLLQRQGLPGPVPLGFLEIIRDGAVETSYILHASIPETLPFHRWLRKHHRSLSAEQRRDLRFFLRQQFLSLYRNGIYHLDSKLMNLLVRERDDGTLEPFWIDLEDIRASRRVPFHAFVRNLYQLNGSLPRTWPVEERLAFVRGFRSLFPHADHPAVLAWVRRKTRRRLLREKARLCSP